MNPEPTEPPTPSVPPSPALEEDIGEFWREHRQDKQARHQQWKAENTRLIEESRIPFTPTNDGESLLFREQGKPKVDFYPSTGRWRSAADGKTRRGGAASFLQWYERQTDDPQPGQRRRQGKRA